MRAQKLRLLVAGGKRARAVERRADDNELVTVEEFTPPHRHAARGPSGMSVNSATHARHGGEPPDVAGRRTDDFARDLAERLNDEARRGVFERLALVAPPRMLRSIREHLSHEARAKVCFELPKDLSQQANHDLRRWLHGPGLV